MIPTLRVFVLLVLTCPLFAFTAPAVAPVTPDASPEARALLQLLHELSGRHTLTGQHNYPAIRDRNTQFATRHIGRMPAVFSTDLGHAKAGDSDSYLARPDIVQECIRQHQLGALVTICWHAVPPTADEPVTFRALPDSDPHTLKSVQGQLLDEQFRDVLTPGTALHAKWQAQVDAIAIFLKQLDAAHVPVLWRPYHEMNGDWFWWGGRTGEFSTARLYRQIFDRLVRHHGLKNLIWVWSVDRPDRPGMEYENFFPGIDYLDVLGLDVYGNDFAPSYYDGLEALSQGKPLALAEVGNPPAPEILARQPKWTFYVTWAGMVRNTTRAGYNALMQQPRILNLDDPRYAEVTLTYREACGLPTVAAAPRPADFSGFWVINEDQSQFGRMGGSAAPARVEIIQSGERLVLKTTQILEFADDKTTEQTIPLDGTEFPTEFMGAARATTAVRSADRQALALHSTGPAPWGPPGTQLVIDETWTLREGRRQLVIHRTAPTPVGRQETTFVFDAR
jgi:mannan endo-1,4-beta-mannosidase